MSLHAETGLISDGPLGYADLPYTLYSSDTSIIQTLSSGPLMFVLGLNICHKEHYRLERYSYSNFGNNPSQLTVIDVSVFHLLFHLELCAVPLQNLKMLKMLWVTSCVWFFKRSLLATRQKGLWLYLTLHF